MQRNQGEDNQPVTTNSDAAQLMIRKKYFCMLESSQAYHRKQVSDIQSGQLLSFNLGSRLFACERLAQGLNRPVLGITVVNRENLDLVVKVDQYAQYVDDSGVVAQISSVLKKA